MTVIYSVFTNRQYNSNKWEYNYYTYIFTALQNWKVSTADNLHEKPTHHECLIILCSDTIKRRKQFLWVVRLISLYELQLHIVCPPLSYLVTIYTNVRRYQLTWKRWKFIIQYSLHVILLQNCILICTSSFFM